MCSGAQEVVEPPFPEGFKAVWGHEILVALIVLGEQVDLRISAGSSNLNDSAEAVIRPFNVSMHL